MKYPLEITGKILAIAPQLYVRDADGQLILYVKQKLLAFREKVELFRDEGQTKLAVTVRADRILDFSANYAIVDANGQVLGNLRRQGMRSIWRASYEVTSNGAVIGTISETNPWKKVIDSLLGQIPLLGVIISMLINPSYTFRDTNDAPVYRIDKRVSFLERKFTIYEQGNAQGRETLLIPAVLMMILLEDDRG
jgi:uncharacterized protein YxjI